MIIYLNYKRIQKIAILFLVIAISSCTRSSSIIVQDIIDKSIVAHGGKLYETANIEFDFRKWHLNIKNDKGRFYHERTFKKDSATIKDILTNENFHRTINGVQQDLTEKEVEILSNSVNSQVYFVLLPYHLNDPAVIKESLSIVEIEGQSYHKIKITFKKENGGKDHDDIFIYFFHTESFKLDYLGYKFHVNSGGIRFRKAINRKTIEGITFQDYINYKVPNKITIADVENAYISKNVTELSRIINKNLKVSK